MSRPNAVRVPHKGTGRATHWENAISKSDFFNFCQKRHGGKGTAKVKPCGNAGFMGAILPKIAPVLGAVERKGLNQAQEFHSCAIVSIDAAAEGAS